MPDQSLESPQLPSRIWRGVLERKHLPALDGLRAIAVSMVILGHLGFSAAPDLGVSLFFVLSGFLITWLLLSERASAGTVSLSRFYVRRALRIIPAYLVFLAISFTLDARLGDPRWRTMLWPSLTYTINYYNAFHGHPITSVAHAWSLAVEEQFYLLWPGVFLLLAPRRRLLPFLLCAIVLVVGWRCLLWYHFQVSTAYVYNAFDTRFDNLAVGCLLAVLATVPGTLRMVDVVARRAWYPLLTIAALVGVRRLGRDYHYGLGFTVDALLFALLVVQLVVLVDRFPWRWLDHPVARYIGRLSYSLYLYHGWGNGLGGKIVPQHGPFRVAVQLAATLILGMASYHLIERPFLRLKRRFETVPGGG